MGRIPTSEYKPYQCVSGYINGTQVWEEYFKTEDEALAGAKRGLKAKEFQTWNICEILLDNESAEYLELG